MKYLTLAKRLTPGSYIRIDNKLYRVLYAELRRELGGYRTTLEQQ